MPARRIEQVESMARSDTPDFFNHKTSWDGLTLMRWGGPRGEIPDYVSPRHQLTIPLLGVVETELHSATGRREGFIRTPEYSCLLPAGQAASLRWRTPTECVTLSLSPTLLARAASDSHLPEQIELVGTEEMADPLVRQIGLALMAEAAGAGNRLYAESLGHTLAMHLVHHYAASSQRRVFTGGLSGSRLRRVQDFINDHLAEDVTLAEMADAAGLSPFHFARAFKRSTGRTPQQYVIERRIERAMQLLAKSALPLIEISAHAGFKNQSHFTTAFRRLTAMTPKAYRETVSA